MTSRVRVTRRFRGPATSGNGGYTAGLLADCSGQDPVGAAADIPFGQSDHLSVRLRTPPPLDTNLDVEVATDATGSPVTWLRNGTTFIAEARVQRLEIEPVPPVSYDAALAATSSYAGLHQHPFPGCFVCGPTRDAGDGLRLFPGRTAPGRTACTWTPSSDVLDDAGLVPPAIVWAALDCPGGWTAEIEGRPMVLGTMTARIDRVPLAGEPCVITGALLETTGRRADTTTTLYGADGAILAVAAAVWMHIDAEAFNRVFEPAVLVPESR